MLQLQEKSNHANRRCRLGWRVKQTAARSTQGHPIIENNVDFVRRAELTAARFVRISNCWRNTQHIDVCLVARPSGALDDSGARVVSVQWSVSTGPACPACRADPATRPQTTTDPGESPWVWVWNTTTYPWIWYRTAPGRRSAGSWRWSRI